VRPLPRLTDTSRSPCRPESHKARSPQRLRSGANRKCPVCSSIRNSVAKQSRFFRDAIAMRIHHDGELTRGLGWCASTLNRAQLHETVTVESPDCATRAPPAGHDSRVFACRGTGLHAGSECRRWTLGWLGAVPVDGPIRGSGTEVLPSADTHVGVDRLDAATHVEFCHQAVRRNVAGHRTRNASARSGHGAVDDRWPTDARHGHDTTDCRGYPSLGGRGAAAERRHDDRNRDAIR
jgi:hypothetical protein